jgi:hypothetical protein
MPRVRFATIVDSGYLARGVVMIESLRQVASRDPVEVLCMDDDARVLLQDLGLEGVHAIDIAELEAYDPELPLVRRERSLAEYCWTAKPSLCRFLFDHRQDAEVIVYADADLMFFADPRSLLDELGDGSALVVPHRAPPHEDWEASRGAFNAGFLAFRRSSEASEILNWWRERCLEWCFDRVEPGRFCDQKYLDEWPSRFSGVRILEDVGGGVAPWNASQHRLSAQHGSVWLDNAVPLVFFHYQSLYVYDGLVGNLVRLGVMSDRFHSVPEHRSLSWSVWASYPVPTDAERHVYVPYVRKLAAAAAQLVERGHTAARTYRQLGPMEILRELARGITPASVRRVVRSSRAREGNESSGRAAAPDEPPPHGS